MEAIVASSVAQYRASVGGRVEYREQVDRLVARSEDFARHWHQGAVEAAPLWQKVLLHPTLGRLTLRYASLAIESGSGLALSIYTPADDATRQALGAAPLQP